MNRWIIIIVVAVLLIAIAAALGLFSPGLAVDAARVETGEVTQYIEERGKTRLPKVHLVTMPVDGRVASIELEAGDSVEKDQVVAKLVQQDLNLALERAQASVDRAKAALRENRFNALENISLEQARSYVKAMADAVEAAAAQMASGKAKMEFASSRFRRIKELAERQVRSEEDLEQAQMEQIQAEVDYQQDKLTSSSMEAIQAATNLLPNLVLEYLNRKEIRDEVLANELTDAEKALAQAKLNYERGTMTSPVDGVVLERAESNERVLPAGTVLLRIADMNQLEIEAEVLSQEAVKITPDDRAEITIPGIEHPPVVGTVKRVEPGGFTKISSLGVEQQRVLVIIGFAPEVLQKFRDTTSIGVDYRVRVRIITDHSTALRVPRSAVFRGPRDAWQVFAIEDGKSRLGDVEIGLMNDHWAAITAGLEADDLVVIAPESNLEDGAKVDAGIRE